MIYHYISYFVLITIYILSIAIVTHQFVWAIMPGLAYKYKLDTDVMSDSNETDCSKSVSSLSSINISSTSPLSNVRVTSSPILHDSLPKDLDDLSLQDSPVLTLPDSPLVPHRSLPTSLISLSDQPVDDLEK